MSAADLHDLELTWPSLSPTDVIVTGTFDQWSSSVHLVKSDGGFFGTVKVPWGQKIAYKYVVDGRWQCRDDRPQEDDGYGNMNNILLTPEKPVPPTLIIPPDVKGDGHSDVETMVTAVEYLAPAEAAAVRGPLPLPIPQITVDLSRTPMMGEAKLDTAGATQGSASPASVTPAAGNAQGPTSRVVPILPINDSSSVPHPLVNGNGETPDSHSFSTHAPIQFTKGRGPTPPPVAVTAQEAAVVLSESATPEPTHAPQGAQEVSASANHVDRPPAGVEEPVAKQPEAGLVETAAQGHSQQAVVPASYEQAPTPSTPSSSTLAHKQRRSLLTRIKHIFDKNKDKRERKEKNKH